MSSPQRKRRNPNTAIRFPARRRRISRLWPACSILAVLAICPGRPALGAPPAGAPQGVSTPAPGEQSPEASEAIGRDERTYRSLPKQPALMVGIEATVDTYGSFLVVRSVQPIYLTAEGKKSLPPLGGPGPAPTIRIEAKEGYAVGAIVATAGNCVDGLRLVFMRRKSGKLEGETLDPSDSYVSRWVGGRGGDGEERIGGDGRPIVGLFGNADDRYTYSIGIFQPRPAAASGADARSAWLRDCLLLMPLEPDTFMTEAGIRYVGDSSGRALWGKVQGPVTLDSGKAGAALKFDGSNDFVLLTGLRPRLLEGHKQITIALWLRCDEPRPQSFAFSVGEFHAKEMAISCKDRQVVFRLPGQSVAAPMEFGRWLHVVGLWDGSQQRIYLDGRLAASKPAANLTLDAEHFSSDTARLGGQAKPYHREGRFFPGAIDEVGIWSRALSEEEIGRLYKKGQEGKSLGD